MADISKIKLPGNNTEYNIKDSTARDRITEAVGDQIRISDRAYTGGNTTVLYRKLAVLPIDNSSNGSSIIISGRCGGWVQSNFGKIEVLLTNRTSAYSGDTVTAAASSSGSSGMYGFCDIVVYAQSNKSAIVYLKIKSYYAYDLVMQTCSRVTEDYSTDSVTPTGTLVWSLSESPQTKLDPEGTLSAPKFKGALEGNVTGNCSGTASNVTGTVAVANGGTGQTSAVNAANAFLNALSTGSSTPTDSDYYISQYVGGGTTTTTYHRRPMSALWNYIKGKIESLVLSTSTSSTSTTTAATSSAVKAAYDLATTANTNAGSAMSAATGAYVLTVTYAISNGTVTCSAHVYSAGSEVTSTFADSCFTWSYNTGAGWVATSTHAKTYTPSVLSAFGGSVKCDFTPPSN